MKYDLSIPEVSAGNQPASGQPNFRLFVDNFSSLVLILNEQGIISYANNASTLLGYAPSKLTGLPFSKLLVNKEEPTIRSHFENAVADIADAQIPLNLQHKNGYTTTFLINSKWVAAEKNFYCTLDPFAPYVHPETNTKQQLIESNLRMQDMLGDITDGYLVVDNNWKFLYVSKKIEELVKLDLETIRTKSFWEIFPKTVGTLVEVNYRKALSLQQSLQFEFSYPEQPDVWYFIHLFPNPSGLCITFRRIDDQKKLEFAQVKYRQELQEHNIRLHNILESIADAFIAVNEKWEITFWNKRAEFITQRPREKTIGKNLWDLFPPTSYSVFYEQYLRAKQEQATVHFETFLEERNIWLEVTVSPWGQGLSVFFRDISERRKREAELRRANERHELISKATSEAIWEWVVGDERIHWHGENVKKITGYDNIAFCTPFIGLKSEEREQVIERFNKTLGDKNQHVWKDEYWFCRADGEFIFVRDKAYIIRDEDGNAIKLTGAITDITEEKRAKDALIRSEKSYKTLFNNAPLPQWIFDLKTLRFLEVNDAAVAHYGYTREEFLEKTLLEIRPHEEWKKLLQDVKVSKHRYQNVGTWTHIKKNGEQISVSVTTSLIDYKGRKARVATINDVTVQKQMEAALQASEESYRRLFENAPQPQLICDAETLKILKVNEAAVNHYGYTREEFATRTVFNFDPEKDKDKLASFIENENNAQAQSCIWTDVKKNGEMVYLEVASRSVVYNNRQAYLITINDITEKRKLEENVSQLKALRHRQITQATINGQERERKELGRELHDNINQVLTTTKLYLEIAETNEAMRLDLISRSKGYLINTINEIRALSKSLMPPTLEDVGLADAIQELIESHQVAKRFQIFFRYDKTAETLPADVKVALFRILQEHLSNVSKHASAKNVWINFDTEADQLILNMEDDGVGMDTKQKRKGGIGLTNIKNRAEMYSGNVNIVSAPGQGFKLTVRIPCAAVCEDLRLTNTADEVATRTE